MARNYSLKSPLVPYNNQVFKQFIYNTTRATHGITYYFINLLLINLSFHHIVIKLRYSISSTILLIRYKAQCFVSYSSNLIEYCTSMYILRSHTFSTYAKYF